MKRRAALLTAILTAAASTGTAARQCFEDPPSVREGGDLYDVVVPTRLSSMDRKAIERLFDRIEGRWSGGSKGYFCRGKKGAARKEADGYRIDLNATRNGPDEILLESDMTSNDNSTVRTERLRLILSDDTLRVGADDRGGDVRILQLPRSDGTIEFDHKFINRPGSDGGVSVTEILRRIHVSATRLTIVYEVYFAGGLASGSTWKLTRK